VAQAVARITLLEQATGMRVIRKNSSSQISTMEATTTRKILGAMAVEGMSEMFGVDRIHARLN